MGDNVSYTLNIVKHKFGDVSHHDVLSFRRSSVLKHNTSYSLKPSTQNRSCKNDSAFYEIAGDELHIRREALNTLKHD